MRILMLSPLYHPYVGGAETHTRVVAEGLAAQGHEIAVVTDRGYAQLPRFERHNGVLIARTTRFTLADADSREAVRWEVGLYGLLADIKDCLAELDEQGYRDPEVIHAQAQGAFLFGAIAAREFAVPLVVTSHETLPFEDRFGYARSAVLHAFGEISMVAAQSRFFAAQALASGVDPARVRLVPAAVPEPDPPLMTAELPAGTREDPLRIVSIGRFKPRKNQLALVGAVHQLVRDGVHVHCTFIGRSDASSKEYRDRVLAQIAELDLARSVRVLSGVDDAERGRLLASSHLAVQPARHEGFGLAALEALFARRIAILAPNDGYQEIVGPGSPFLVTGFSATALAGAIRDVLNHPARYTAELERLLPILTNRHGVRYCAKATEVLYQDAVAHFPEATGG